MANDCIFCKIIKGEIPCYKVYEDDKVIAFLDIAPVNPGHVLVVPKEHFEKIENLPDDMLCEITKAVKKISMVILKAVNADSYNLGVNNGKTAGQLVPHVHFHIMPRFENDGLKLFQGKKGVENDMEKIAESIRKAL
jgi:histidine triad (HIT) family protein